MIKFRKIRYQNFISAGNEWTELDLEQTPTTLVVGENGAGKSTMLDALMFSLYGKPYRKVNKGQLVNSVTTKKCLVEVEFESGGVEYLIRRGISPAVFEIFEDGKLKDQDAGVREYQEYLEKHILRLGEKSFTQIVIIGSANFVPFMQLKAAERRKVIEDLLDIEIFSTMKAVLKQRQDENKKALTEAKHQVDLLSQKIDMTKDHINKIRSIQKNSEENRQKKIDEQEQKIESLLVDIRDRGDEIEDLKGKITDKKKVEDYAAKCREYKWQIENKIRTLDKELAFLHDHDKCKTCEQDIDADFKNKQIDQKESKRDELATGLKQLAAKYTKVNDQLQQISTTEREINDRRMTITSLQSQVDAHRQEIESIGKENNNVVEDDDESFKQLDQMTKQLDGAKKQHEEYSDLQQLYDKGMSLLKDGGIKSQLIKQYIPVINKLMNKYLAAMDFFVQFELDENFNETIKSRHRDEFTYESFSEGEKMRIDLSLLFTWRAVAKLRNSISTNLLILDEVFDSSLDTSGTDEFLRIITQMSEGTNVFVISHKGDQLYDKFHKVLKFEKNQNFSKLVTQDVT